MKGSFFTFVISWLSDYNIILLVFIDDDITRYLPYLHTSVSLFFTFPFCRDAFNETKRNDMRRNETRGEREGVNGWMMND